MFYKMIERACSRWYEKPDCPALPIVSYIEARGFMRDAQIGAIKTYLFLKMACDCKPLSELFGSGCFNSLDLDKAELSHHARQYFYSNPCAAALYEYASQLDDKGVKIASGLEKKLRMDPEVVDCEAFFKDAFYGVDYSDYLFSLPMGAGKTFLMSAFIYLDLYFSRMEPDNPAFAHNFIIFAPSGLKSSVIPSLRTIQNFNVSWVIPEPAASELKRSVIFEVLDQPKATGKSNRTKNPNVQKIASHQPIKDLYGFVAVTNAEKVILDRLEEKDIFERSEDEKEKYRQANELRDMIGTIPSLGVFIDEVHHAVTNEIKLRKVVSSWAESGKTNCVIGFSGTPYLEKQEKINVDDSLSVKSVSISNTVYYYPLVKGVDNFLKRPVIRISDSRSTVQIIENGIREFLTEYKDTVYEGGLCAKLGIYCGTIEKLETVVYPAASMVVSEFGLSPDVILKFHRGDKKFVAPPDGQLKFDTLDTSLSNIRIILLVQIGKEGWDCKSLAGVILSQEGDCPTNMVLQTSCRCLRQVKRGEKETALIYLNHSNAEKLEKQLILQHHSSIKEFQSVRNDEAEISRYDRRLHLQLPPVDYYQMSIRFETVETKYESPGLAIIEAVKKARRDYTVIQTTNLSLSEKKISYLDDETGTKPANFIIWLNNIAKESFGTLTLDDLMGYDRELRTVFNSITIARDDERCFSSKYDIGILNSFIRKAFCNERRFISKEETIPDQASWLNIENFTEKVKTANPDDYYPSQERVKNIIKQDKENLKLTPEVLAMIKVLEDGGDSDIAAKMREKYTLDKDKESSFHYIPYHFDSAFELGFLEIILSLEDIKRHNLEVYYNGDRSLSDFKIKCYRCSGQGKVYVGMYTPDFLVIQRKDGKIRKIVIVETKGKVYSNDPAFKDRRLFVENEFVAFNNKAFGYKRFDFLYLEDSLSERDRTRLIHDKINCFFGGEK